MPEKMMPPLRAPEERGAQMTVPQMEVPPMEGLWREVLAMEEPERTLTMAEEVAEESAWRRAELRALVAARTQLAEHQRLQNHHWSSPAGALTEDHPPQRRAGGERGRTRAS
jgi:hypothetical protein